MDVFGNFDEGAGNEDWTAAGATTDLANDNQQTNLNSDAGQGFESLDAFGTNTVSAGGDAGGNDMFAALNMNGAQTESIDASKLNGNTNTENVLGDVSGAFTGEKKESVNDGFAMDPSNMMSSGTETISNSFPTSQFGNSMAMGMPLATGGAQQDGDDDYTEEERQAMAHVE